MRKQETIVDLRWTIPFLLLLLFFSHIILFSRPSSSSSFSSAHPPFPHSLDTQPRGGVGGPADRRVPCLSRRLCPSQVPKPPVALCLSFESKHFTAINVGLCPRLDPFCPLTPALHCFRNSSTPETEYAPFYTWPNILGGWFRHLDEVVVPLTLPPCLVTPPSLLLSPVLYRFFFLSTPFSQPLSKPVIVFEKILKKILRFLFLFL
jgi:hypothetical protein